MAKKETILIKLDIDTNEAKKKIVENTTAVRNYGEQNKALAKSLKEGKITEDQYTKSLLDNKQAVTALTAENKQLDLSIKASENSVEGLRANIALLTAEANKLDLNSEEFEQAQAKLKELNDALIEVGSDRSDFRTNVGNYGSAVTAFEGKIASLESKLQGLDINSKAFQETRAEIAKTTEELDKLKTGVGGIEGKLNDFGNSLSGISGSFSNLGTSLSAAFGPVAIVAGIVAATGALINFKMELDATREQVNLLTGATGNSLDKITAKVSATSSVFDKDFNETLLTANTVAKQFGIGVEESLDLIQKGFVNGADSSGNFLADLTEFAPQFNAIGVSADEAIAILSQQPESGVFSNKGIDAIKEAGLRLKEMPQATKDALDAIGLSSKTIQQQIEDGTTTSFQAIQQISAKLADLPANSQVAAEAVSNIFGGAGQDAGLDYLKTLKDVETNLDTLTDGAGDFAKANLQIVDAQERIDLLFNQILGGGGNTFKELKGAALDFVANALDFIVNGIIEVINYFRSLYNESIVFRGAIQLIKFQVESTWAAIKAVFTGFIDQLKNASSLIKAIFTGDFAAIPELLKGVVTDAVATVKGFGKEVAEDFNAAVKETIDPAVFLEPISLAEAEAIEGVYAAGLAVGEAFNAGVKMSREDYLKDQKAFLETQLLLVAKNSQAELELKRKLIEVQRDIDLEAEGLTRNQKTLIRTQAFVDEQEATKDHYETLKQLAAEKLEAEIAAIEEGELRKTLALQLQFLQREIDETTFNENLFTIREKALEDEINQLTEGSTAKMEKEVELAQLRADRITEAKQKEAETSNMLKEVEIGNDRAIMESAQMLADGVVQIAGETSTAGKIAAGVAKGLALAEIVFNLQQELAANAAAGAKISAQAAPYTVAAGVTYTTTRNILAGVRAGIGIAKIGATMFEHGGVAGGDNIAFSGGHIPRYGGMITGRAHREGGVKFNMGNRVGEADGRKGEAYIVNTRNNPTLRSLASAINVAGGGRGFSGHTAMFDNGGVASGVNTGSLLLPPATDFAAILENMPTPIVLVDDIVNGTNQKIEVENGAIL
jgi:hypothetical protein